MSVSIRKHKMANRDNSWSARQQVRDADVVGGGGDEGTRTPDPRDANAVLFRLSYIPMRGRSHALGAIAGRECSTAPGAGGRAGVARHMALPNIEQMFYRWLSDGPQPRPHRRPRLPPGALGRGSSAAGDGGVRRARGGLPPDGEPADVAAADDGARPHHAASRRSAGDAPAARHREAKRGPRRASFPTRTGRHRPDDPDGLSRARRG